MVKKNISFRKKRGGGPIFYEATYNQNKNEVEVQDVDMGAKISDERKIERQQFNKEKEQLQTSFEEEKEQLLKEIQSLQLPPKKEE